MHRIDSSGAVAVLPAPAAVGSTVGYWSNGDPVGGIQATQLDQDWFNSVQEELVGIVVAAGLTPDKTNRAQVLTALRTLFGGNMRVFASFGTTTWTVPAGVTKVRARVWGAGGGGGVFGGGFPSGGGGGGGYAEGVYTVTPGASIAVTVGLGGVANAAGGSSSFGTYCSATGGQPGTNGTGAGVGLGGNGGIGTGGALNVIGSGGGAGIVLTSGDKAGGNGGGTFCASSTGYPWIGGAAIGGAWPGGGASGQPAAGSTASGGNGLVIIEW